MENKIPFKCPSCGCTEFSVASEPKSHDDLIGAACTGCGRVLAEEDIKRQAIAVADKLITDALKGFKF